MLDSDAFSVDSTGRNWNNSLRPVPTTRATFGHRGLCACGVKVNWWALRDSNPRPAECKWEPICRHRSSTVEFVDVYCGFGCLLSPPSYVVEPV